MYCRWNMSFGRLFLYERSVGFIFVSANMEQWGMERVRKQQLLEQSIYGVIWSVIFFLPLIGEYFAVSGGLEKEEVRTLVRDSWLGILPFFGWLRREYSVTNLPYIYQSPYPVTLHSIYYRFYLSLVNAFRSRIINNNIADYNKEVKCSDWFKKYVNAAAFLGYITDNFEGSHELTREEAVKYIKLLIEHI